MGRSADWPKSPKWATRRPHDGRRALVSLTEAGLTELREDRLRREGWLVRAIEELPSKDQATVERAIVLLRQLADAGV